MSQCDCTDCETRKRLRSPQPLEEYRMIDTENIAEWLLFFIIVAVVGFLYWARGCEFPS